MRVTYGSSWTSTVQPKPAISFAARREESVVGSADSGRILAGNSVRLNGEIPTDRLAANSSSEEKDDQDADTTRHLGLHATSPT